MLKDEKKIESNNREIAIRRRSRCICQKDKNLPIFEEKRKHAMQAILSNSNVQARKLLYFKGLTDWLYIRRNDLWRHQEIYKEVQIDMRFHRENTITFVINLNEKNREKNFLLHSHIIIIIIMFYTFSNYQLPKPRQTWIRSDVLCDLARTFVRQSSKIIFSGPIPNNLVAC